MEAIFNQDSSFFLINISDGTNISNDVINLQVIEELGKFISGSISFYDPSFYYSKELRAGSRFTLTWGYKKRNEGLTELQVKTINPKELTGSGIRRGLQCIVTNPSWSGSNGGVLTYNCNFYSAEFGSNIYDAKVYESGKKSDVIYQAMTSLGVQSFFIDFNVQNDILNSNTFVRQNETTFKFLVRLAYEWRCVFKIGYTPSGQLAGMFIDNSKIGSTISNTFISLVTGAIGSTKLLEFGVNSKNPNVINYSGQHHVGENGQGDQVKIDIINGQMLMTRYISKTGKTQILTLNSERLKKFIDEHIENSLEISKRVYAVENLDAEVWEGKTVRSFFDAVDITTCPQGFGFTFNCSMIGDPSMSPPVEMIFGNGFPPQIQEVSEINKLYCKKVTHTLNNNGYKMAVESADAITIFGAFIK